MTEKRNEGIWERKIFLILKGNCTGVNTDVMNDDIG